MKHGCEYLLDQALETGRSSVQLHHSWIHCTFPVHCQARKPIQNYLVLFQYTFKLRNLYKIILYFSSTLSSSETYTKSSCTFPVHSQAQKSIQNYLVLFQYTLKLRNLYKIILYFSSTLSSSESYTKLSCTFPVHSQAQKPILNHLVPFKYKVHFIKNHIIVIFP